MKEEKKDNKILFITCPTCEGTGKNKYGFGCSDCAGMALGTFFNGRFFYWGPKLTKTTIEINHFRKKFNVVINIFSYIIGLAGLLSLVFWIYQTSQGLYNFQSFVFWREKSGLILFFWVSVLADMFVFYRMNEEQRRQYKIKPFQYKETNTDFPNNWEELVGTKSNFKIDVATGFPAQTLEFVEQAFLLADSLNHRYVTLIHLFFVILSDIQVSAIFSRLNVDSKKLIENLKRQIEKIEISDKKTELSRTIKEALIESYIQVYKLQQRKVTPKNFIIPCLEKDKMIKEILYDLEIDKNKIYNVILWFIVNDKLIEAHRQYRKMAGYKPGSNMDKAYTSVATPILNQLGYDLTVAAKWNRLEYCISREKEIENIFQNFESGEHGVILTGPPNVGKNMVVAGIAQRMVSENVPDIFKDKRLVEMDAARLISGATPSQAEGRMMAIIDELAKSKNIVLFIDNIENIIGITSGEEQSLDLSEVLASSLERNDFYCIASSTNKNYIKYIENTALGNTMKRINIEEPEENQAIQMLESKIGHIEVKYKIYFSYSAIEQVIKLSKKYIHDQYLPGKAVNILELVAVRTAKKGKNSIVSEEDISEVISEITSIPISKVGEDEGKKLLNLEKQIHERMINQVEAVEMVSASLRRARIQMREDKRPIASFLFLGPTGVGKTELAKTVSSVYFGDEKYMIRLDMSEYQHPDSIKKMIGDASGTKGYLTEQVRKSPFSLVLLDEIEKAHGDILNLFLACFDDGRLTDGEGRTIDFTNTIIIATSNAGALYIQDEVRKGTPIEKIEQVLVNEHLNKIMRPELINRFDGIIVFKPLSMENVVDIARLMLIKTGRMLEKKGIGFRVDERGLKKIAEMGFDPQFGARPLRRLLQDSIDNEIANSILGGRLERRDTVIIDDGAQVQIQKGKEL